MIKRLKKDVYYLIDFRHRLLIFGRGGIPDYAPVTDLKKKPPWAGMYYKEVIIKRGITHIGAYAFYGNDFMKRIKIAETVRDIHPTSLMNIHLDSVIIEKKTENEHRMEVTDSGLYDNYENELICARDEVHVKIREGTETIHPFAFAFHQNTEIVECPASLQRIGVSAFEGCKNLKEICRVPAEAVLGKKALKETSGVRIYFDKNVPKRRVDEIYPKAVVTEHGRGLLVNGEFRFFASENVVNIDPTKFYRCRDLIDIKGGKDFMIGLRANGKVIYADTNAETDIFDLYREPFRFEQYSSFERLKGWKNIRQIDADGEIAAGLCEDGTVYCTNTENENEPIKNMKEIVFVQVKNGRIQGVRADGECILHF